MTRFESLLKTPLFENPTMRSKLKKMLEKGLCYLTKEEIDLRNEDVLAILSEDILRNEICRIIRDSKFYINFEHESSDKILQKYVFMSLLFSYREFSDEKAWEKFLQLDHDLKKAQLLDGILTLWATIQRKQGEIELNSTVKNIGEDDLPF
jgi:hypothetical protein